MSTQPLLKVHNLSKSYARKSFLSREHKVDALADVDLEIAAGTTLAIVGESGSGKSTLARCIAGMERPDSGAMWFEGRDLLILSPAERRRYSSHIQLVLQHSAGALNPRFTANDVIEEPLLLQRLRNAQERKERASSALQAVEMSPEWGMRRTLQFSGGQRQRLSLARALVLKPRLLILDEALTGLDLPIQSQILDLLTALQRQHGLTYLFISHDLEAVAAVADDIAIMRAGRVVEQGSTQKVMWSPQHEYTKALLSAQSLLSGAASA